MKILAKAREMLFSKYVVPSAASIVGIDKRELTIVHVEMMERIKNQIFVVQVIGATCITIIESQKH